MAIPQNILETKAHLGIMMAKERLSGEFLLASVVQDSLTYNLHDYASHEGLMPLARDVAEVAVESVHESLRLNEFTLCETVRGALHALVSLGGNPLEMAVAIAMGSMRGLRVVVPVEAAYFAASVLSGIESAAVDLGLEPSTLTPLAAFVLQSDGPSDTDLPA